LSVIVEIDEFAVFPLPYLRKFQKRRHSLHITTTERSGFLAAPIRMNLNDLECPIHLKVRLVDGMLDVRLLPVSDSTIRNTPIGVARGGGGGVCWKA